MPGVPSGQGCDACRSQKKKCDQSRPSCSRCTRLEIICIGSGQQKFKFKQEIGYSSLAKHRRKPLQKQCIICLPSNEQTLLASALVEKLNESTDSRSCLSWIYGGYLADIPQRLGRSKALDAAVAALVSAHSNYVGSQRFASPEALSRYYHAITTLRLCLDDRTRACTAETLCAVTLLPLCQGFLGVHEGLRTSHCEGAVQILKVRGFYNKNDEFERKLLLALRGSVLFQALFSDNIQMSSCEWKLIVENELDESSCERRMMQCLARVTDLLRRGREALQEGTSNPELWQESMILYNAMKLTLKELHDRLENWTAGEACHLALVAVKTRAHYQRTYALGLATSIILNCLLSGFDTEHISLDIEAQHFSQEIIALSVQVAIFRPIAASYMTLCLITAWGGATDAATKTQAENLLRDYLQDFSYEKVVIPTTELAKVFRRLRLMDTIPKKKNGCKEADDDIDRVIADRNCAKPIIPDIPSSVTISLT